MKKKVTQFLVEITLNDLATNEYINEILDDEDIASFKVLKKKDVSVDEEE